MTFNLQTTLKVNSSTPSKKVKRYIGSVWQQIFQIVFNHKICRCLKNNLNSQKLKNTSIWTKKKFL